VEAFRAVDNFIMACQKHRKIDKIVDVACGHGLVGLLLAYRFVCNQPTTLTEYLLTVH
jgi:tRNA1(Val) A37 N6-methylase TrmN6